MELTIEKLIYGGDGLAHLPADERGDGKAVFVPFVLPGERVDATVTENKPGFARARLNQVLQPYAGRSEPGCPYFGQCGGCHYQHASYEQQLRIKTDILRETLRRIAKLEFEDEIRVHVSPPWNYRNRTRMRVLAEPEFALGYNRFASRALLPVRECPISSPLINRAISVLWEMGRARRVWHPVTEIEFFTDADDATLLVELTVPDGYWKTRSHPDVLEFVVELRANLPEIAGVAVFKQLHDGSLVREEVPDKLRDTFGADALTYCAAGCNYQVSAGSFFQVNRFLVDKMISLVTGDRTGDTALDLYAGTGLFTLPLSQNFRQVTAVEAAPFSFHDLRANLPAYVTAYRTTTETFLANLPSEARPYYVVADPPRSGLGEKVTRRLAELAAPRLTYVSCDPATLARDLRVLTQARYRMTELHLLDLFPQTFHIETVVRLAL